MKLDTTWFTQEDIDLISNFIRSGQLSGFWKSSNGGKYLQLFEKSFYEYIGTKNAIAVSNGSTSILLGLLASGVKSGDAVAVSPYTHVGSVCPILQIGATPIFIDVEANTGNMNVASLKKILNAGHKLKAVIVAHQQGTPCKVDEIKDLVGEDVLIIEDCSQSLGAEYKGRKVGSIGDVGCFSVGGDMTKTISTGEGGIITTNNDEIAERCRALRNHGDVSGKKYLCFNYRLSELQAMIGFMQMKRLPLLIDWQVNNAKYLLSEIPIYLQYNGDFDDGRVYYILNLTFNEKIAGFSRNHFLDYVRKEKIEGGLPRKNIGPGYSRLIYNIPLYKKFPYKCRSAEEMLKKSIWFDWHRYPITNDDIDSMVAILKRCK